MNDKMSCAFAFMRYVEIALSIDNFERVMKCPCSRGATRDAWDHTVTPNLQADDNNDVEDCDNDISFTFIRSLHHAVGSKC